MLFIAVKDVVENRVKEALRLAGARARCHDRGLGFGCLQTLECSHLVLVRREVIADLIHIACQKRKYFFRFNLGLSEGAADFQPGPLHKVFAIVDERIDDRLVLLSIRHKAGRGDRELSVDEGEQPFLNVSFHDARNHGVAFLSFPFSHYFSPLSAMDSSFSQPKRSEKTRQAVS